MTALPLCGEVPKHDPRVEVLGALDELVCALGMVRAVSGLSHALRDELMKLQRDLFRLGSFLAGASPARALARQLLARWNRRCASLERTVPWPTGFVLPGATEAGARLDVARAAARRLERRYCSLAAVHPLNPSLTAALNRLSDYLWLLARAAEPQPDLLDERTRRGVPLGIPRR